MMEKKKRGRPKVDASLTETVYRESRRQAVNRKYVFDGVGVLMDCGEQIPDNKLLYNLERRICKPQRNSGANRSYGSTGSRFF